MTKRNIAVNSRIGQWNRLFAFLSIALTIACLALTLILNQSLHTNKQDSPKRNTGPYVSLGSIEYTFHDGKATKLSTPLLSKLRDFLNNKSVNEGCQLNEPGYEHIILYTKDKRQVLIRYGCGAADSPMYVIYADDKWRSLSPTNQFDMLHIPHCSYVNENSISKEIAPVCYTVDGQILDYTAR